MRAGIGQQYGESVSKEELGISGHSDAVIAKAVEEDHSVAVALAGTNRPGTQGDGIRGGDGNIFQVGV